MCCRNSLVHFLINGALLGLREPMEKKERVRERKSERDIKKKSITLSVFLTVGIIASRVSHYCDGSIDVAPQDCSKFFCSLAGSRRRNIQ